MREVNSNLLNQQAYVHPIVAGAMVVIAVLIFFLRRRHVIVPFLSAAFLIPMDQLLAIGPFHFQMLRVLILLGWIRLVVSTLTSRSPFLSTGMNALDKLVIAFALIDAIDYVLLWQGSTEAIINRLGSLYTVLGIYFLLRFLIRDEKDIVVAIRVLACVSAVIAVVMVIEVATGRSPYAYLGGMRAWTRASLMAREEHIRAIACFQHPILAGTFGGILLPLFIGLWLKDRRRRVAAIIGVLSVTVIVVASASSTPIMAYLSGVLALCLWPLRRHMRLIRWGVAVSLIALHLVMKAPIWALVQRVDLVGGSSGHHRYYLLDRFIRRFGDWWLLGVKSTDTWGPDMWDRANQYVAVGETSGVVPLVLFLAIIVFAFKYLGFARKRLEGDRNRSLFLWALGAALFANVVGFFGISYFDQTVVVWWGLLAMISVAVIVPQKRETLIQVKSVEADSLSRPLLESSDGSC